MTGYIFVMIIVAFFAFAVIGIADMTGKALVRFFPEFGEKFDRFFTEDNK